MPTIGEIHQHQDQTRAVNVSRSKSLYVRRRRDSGLPAGAAETGLGRVVQPGRVEKRKPVVVSTAANGIPPQLNQSFIPLFNLFVETFYSSGCRFRRAFVRSFFLFHRK
jgi:hypothetical protein